MSDLSIQKRLAAEVAGVGISRVRFDTEKLDIIEGAITRETIKRLIKDGVIIIKPAKSNSRGRWRVRRKRRSYGRYRGHGSRKGKKGARADEKREWMYRIRKIRRYLRWLRDHDIIDRRTYRRLYMLAKGGVFSSLADLKRYIITNDLAKGRIR
ncbi:MAG: 50S ribosomal protein L19e [Thermoprotei archaeon]|nr:MAG: 50S ribosomal protein L19e [Thermoprotei archaeon]